VFCESNTLSANIQHVVTLGVYCTDLPPDEPYFYADLYFECAGSTDQFDVLSDDTLFNTTSNRYACTASAIFAPDSTSSNPLVISSVAITTDDLWLSRMDETCFTSSSPFLPFTSMDQPTSSPTKPPVASPRTKPPVASPPTKLPVATAAPILPQETTPTISVQSPESNNDSGKVVGGVVGGIAAGIVIMSLIGFFVFRRPADSSNVPKAEVHDDVADAPLSFPEGTARHDDLLGPVPMAVAAYTLPTAVPIAPSTNNYNVDYKDQARTVQPETPAAAVAEVVPYAAVALDASVASGGSQKPTQPEPPGRVFLEL
jgi:hypothetical protein